MKIFKYILFAIMLSTIFSCESFLDRPPLDQIGTDSYWKTAKDLENYVLQYYPGLPSHGGGAGMPMEDASSDNIIMATANDVMNGERITPNGNWINEWSKIRSINIFFDNYRKCEDSFNNYRHFLGEAHFFKAWFYFELVQKYGDVPWYTHPLYPDSDDEMKRPRDPRTMVVDSILAHIDKAIMYLDTRAAANGGNNRLNKEAALAFKTRVGLFEGSWQKYHAGTAFGTQGANPSKYFQASVDAAEELINGSYTRGIYSTGKPGEDYYNLFAMSDMSDVNEVLFYRAANNDDAMGHNVQVYVINNTNGMGITWELVTSYLGKDGAPYDYLNLAENIKGNSFLTQIATDCDPRLKSTVWMPGDLRIAFSGAIFDKPWIDRGGVELCPTGFQVKKFSAPYSEGAGMPWGGFSDNGYIIFRYGEVLLNYAEAKYELDGTIPYQQLNLLRARAGMPDFAVNGQESDYSPVDYGYDISDELYEIRRERRVEMALEGHRENDYKRWAAHALFKGKRLLGYPFNANEFPNYDPSLTANGLIDYLKSELPDGYMFRENMDYLNGIPRDEFVLNPNLTQNPGWD